jgi:hypothetical protein
MDIDKILSNTLNKTTDLHSLFEIHRNSLKSKNKSLLYFKDDDTGRVHFVQFTRNLTNVKEMDIDAVCNCIIGKHCCNIEVTYRLYEDLKISGYKIIDEPKYKLILLKIRRRIKLDTDL